MQILDVNLSKHSYPIYIGSNILNNALVTKHIIGKQVAIITNTTVADLYLNKLKNILSDFEVTEAILPDGESYKNWQTLHTIFDVLLKNKCERSVTIIALGGGVVGDMAGFAASCYLRGVNFIQVPTTLLSQVDSSVGGKTGVNHPLGKNMLGSFYQPQAVIIDIDTLNTLPKREISAGLAEVIKYGLIADANFFDWLRSNIDLLLNLEQKTLIYAINHSCSLKAQIVGEDERETGIRAILNLGHTFGHAIETYQGYGVWLHGEAVAVGMVMALQMGVFLSKISNSDFLKVVDLLTRASLPVIPPANMTAEIFMQYMSQDKKISNGKLRLVLLEKIGSAYMSDNYAKELLVETLNTNFAQII